MIRRYLCLFYLAIAASIANADDCAILDQESTEYEAALQAMSGHFPVPLDDIEYCGVAGYSKLFKTVVKPYEHFNGWRRHGELECWQLSQHKPGEPYSCGRRIVNRHLDTELQVIVKHPISLQLIDEIFTRIQPELGEDRIEWIEYVPVKCGGAWSAQEYGFVVKLAVTEPQTRHRFSAKKMCSPTPCVGQFEKLSPETWVH